MGHASTRRARSGVRADRVCGGGEIGQLFVPGDFGLTGLLGLFGRLDDSRIGVGLGLFQCFIVGIAVEGRFGSGCLVGRRL